MRHNQLIYTLNFAEIGLKDIGRVGGKNASLGELFNSLKPKGVGVIDGFATTADAYRALLAEGELEYELRSLVSDFDYEDVEELRRRGYAARVAILDMPLPKELRDAVTTAYEQLCKRLGREPELAVRSSATAEDLPEASFAGAAETFLNVRGREALLRAVHQCFASLFTDRAISYRARLGYDHLKVAISVGVQPMVRSDKASSGVIFTLDTESGFRDVVLISSSYGLGEFVVQGVVTPDEWLVFKPTLKTGHRPIVGRRLGTKEIRLVHGEGRHTTRRETTSTEQRSKFSLTDNEVLKLARWACVIEEHYSKQAGHPQPMDIEWAKDGNTGELFIVQARPETVHSSKKVVPAAVPRSRTQVMLTIGDPARAFQMSFVPNDGVGLARTEFIVTNHIGIHPMALARFPNLKDASVVRDIASRIGDEDPREFFIRRFSEGVGRIAAAFYPKPVIVRTSDFKTNEYARLLGGSEFEPQEEKPMLGFRGAARYYDPRYADGFALECAALLRVRKEMGLTNVKIMIPFCRTVTEAKRVIEVMAQHGLRQRDDGLEIYAMCELPSNVIRAEEFLKVFDGYSIGSNDLTQLVLGIDRDSGTVSHLFDENDRAVLGAIADVIHEAHRARKPVGICGQAPSDFPEFARWLVEQGITSISLNPDVAITTALIIAAAEGKQKASAA